MSFSNRKGKSEQRKPQIKSLEQRKVEIQNSELIHQLEQRILEQRGRILSSQREIIEVKETLIEIRNRLQELSNL